jgi:3-phenylpropionate/trans-cinnamate dioxygenase ferredoxin subunit
MDSEYVRASGKLEIDKGEMKKVILVGRDILIVNIDGNYYAVGGECTHFGGDLSEGILEGNVITCPNHKARFDVTTGKVVSGPVEALSRPDIEDLPKYLVKVEKQDIMIKV